MADGPAQHQAGSPLPATLYLCLSPLRQLAWDEGRAALDASTLFIRFLETCVLGVHARRAVGCEMLAVMWVEMVSGLSRP